MQPGHDSLPTVLKSVRTRPLFVMTLAIQPYLVVGETPGVNRRVGVVPGGTFDGERLAGTVTNGGVDWQTSRNDGATTLDVRLVLKTTDDALISMSYQGLRHGPPSRKNTSKPIAFEVSGKRRKYIPSETHVKRGDRVVGGTKELLEKLGRNDPCPCGSGRRF